MASSISPSDARIPRWALRLVAVAVLTWLAGAVYSLRLNPEVGFFCFGARQKQAWLQELRASHTNVTIICGGSSVGTSVIGRRLLENHGLPVVNLGFGAGMGAKVLSRYALQQLRPGDNLVLAFEADLLTGTVELEPLGVQFALANGMPELLREGRVVHWPSVLLDLRPGGYHVITLMAKMAMRKPLYRYAQREFEPDGTHVVETRLTVNSVEASNLRLSAQGKALLTLIRDSCAQRGVRVAYGLSWSYCRPESTAAVRQCYLRFLSDVAGILPVLKDPTLGIRSDPACFADMSLHPTREGAQLRTDELAASLKTWSLWRPEELAAAAQDGITNPVAKP